MTQDSRHNFVSVEGYEQLCSNAEFDQNVSKLCDDDDCESTLDHF